MIESAHKGRNYRENSIASYSSEFLLPDIHTHEKGNTFVEIMKPKQEKIERL